MCEPFFCFMAVKVVKELSLFFSEENVIRCRRVSNGVKHLMSDKIEDGTCTAGDVKGLQFNRIEIKHFRRNKIYEKYFMHRK